MKPIILCISFLIISFGNKINAQAVRFGVKGGTILSFPAVSPSPEYSKNTHVGFLIGMHLDFNLNKKFTARLETDFMDKSVEYENNFFVDIPLNFIYKIPANKNKFLLGGGPVLGIRTSEGNSNQFNKTDFGINLMAGYEFEIGFSINLNYTHGVVNTVDHYFYYSDFKNRTAGITVGYIF